MKKDNEMDKLEQVKEYLDEIYEDINSKSYSLNKIKSKYLKELLENNIIETRLILKCVKSILVYNLYLKSDYRKKELLINSLKEMKKDFNIDDEDLLKIINQDAFYDNLKIMDDYIAQKIEPLVIFNDGLIDIAVSVLKKEYSSLQENIIIIANNIADFIPVVSKGKQIVEIIKDLAECVNNLDIHKKYHDKIKAIDSELEDIEMENNLLAKVFHFLFSFNFVRENFDKDINEIEKYI